MYVSYECEAGLESLHIGVKIAFSGPASHSKSGLCTSHTKLCEAGLESLHVGGKNAFSGPASHSKSSLWCVHVV